MVSFHSPLGSLVFSYFVLLSDSISHFCVQGIDLVAGGKSKKTKRTAPKSDDIYLKLIVKVLSLSVFLCLYFFMCIGFVIDWLEVVFSCTASLCEELEASSMRWYWKGCLWARSTSLHFLSRGWSATWGERFVFISLDLLYLLVGKLVVRMGLSVKFMTNFSCDFEFLISDLVFNFQGNIFCEKITNFYLKKWNFPPFLIEQDDTWFGDGMLLFVQTRRSPTGDYKNWRSIEPFFRHGRESKWNRCIT